MLKQVKKDVSCQYISSKIIANVTISIVLNQDLSQVYVFKNSFHY